MEKARISGYNPSDYHLLLVSDQKNFAWMRKKFLELSIILADFSFDKPASQTCQCVVNFTRKKRTFDLSKSLTIQTNFLNSHLSSSSSSWFPLPQFQCPHAMACPKRESICNFYVTYKKFNLTSVSPLSAFPAALYHLWLWSSGFTVILVPNSLLHGAITRKVEVKRGCLRESGHRQPVW